MARHLANGCNLAGFVGEDTKLPFLVYGRAVFRWQYI